MIAYSVSSLLIAMFALWAALSVLTQFSPWYCRVRPQGRLSILTLWAQKVDAIPIIAVWTFFAPRPGTFDQDVLFRDELVDGTRTPWRSLCENALPWESVVWNPQKRSKKAIADMARSLLQLASAIDKSNGKRDPRHAMITVPYIGLVTRISAVPRSPLSVRTQFMISFSHGYASAKEPQPLYLSALFQLK